MPLPAPVPVPGKSLAELAAIAAQAALSDVTNDIAGLATDLPLALLPVRITTRYAADGEKVTLKVRITPDELHTPQALTALTTEEITAARAFWTTMWSLGSDKSARAEALRALCADFASSWRAAWAARQTRPANWSDPPPAAAPTFREPAAPAATERPLPERWVVLGWKGGKPVLGPKAGNPIPAALKLVPEIQAPASAATASEWLAAQGLDWMEDFDAAVRAGMALSIDVTGTEAAGGLDMLLVLGVRAGQDAIAEADRLESLLAAHAAEHGVELLGAGTATNNTDEGESGFSLSSPDMESLLAEVLWSSGATPAADGVCRALGLGQTSLLHRVKGAAGDPSSLAAAMNGALWPASIGWMLRSACPVGLSEEDIGAARDHFVKWVRPGGAFPAIRTGALPWGLLPARMPSTSGSAWLDRLERVLSVLTPTWNRGVGAVARMDADAADQPATGAVQPDAISRVSTVLAGVPNPVRFALRNAENQQGRYEAQLFLFTLFADAGFNTDGGVGAPIEAALAADLGAAKTLEDEIAAWKKALSATKTARTTTAGKTTTVAPKLDAIIDLIEDYVLPLLEGHLARIRPVLGLGVDRTKVTGKLSSSYAPLFYAFHEADAVDWSGPIVGDNPDASLAALQAQLNGGAPATETPPSLLFTLLQRSVTRAHVNDKPALSAGLAGLRAVLAGGAQPRELGRAMRETLSAAMFRLDAWTSSVAIRVLDEKRTRKARGVQLGAWGLVVDLKRRTSQEAISQGFLHAPSLAQAVTGAVLRSGWSALGSDGQTSPLSVDLSSDRVRRAEEILEAVRAGEALSVLLGQRLERRLHDRALDRYVDELRKLAVARRGPALPTRAALLPCDGEAIARAWSGGDTFAPLTTAEKGLKTNLDALVNSVSLTSDGWADPPRTRMRASLDDTLADLDAVADVLLSEGVHHLLQGNPARAGASLSALGRGELPPPDLTLARSIRGGVAITHRLALALPKTLPAATPWPARTTSPAALAEPRLEAWVSDRLGAPGDIGFVLVRRNGTRVASRLYESTRAAWTLGALDFLGLAGDGGGELERWILARAAQSGPAEVLSVDAADAAGAAMSLADAVLAARALRQLLHGGRALRPADLSAASDTGTSAGGDGFDLSELGGRAGSVLGALQSSRAALASALSTAEAGGSTTALSAQVGALIGQGVRVGHADVLDQGRRGLAELDARIALAGTAVDARMEAHAERLQQLVGRHIPILPLFTPADGAALDTGIARGLGGGGDALGWLSQAAKVREKAAALAKAVDIVEAARDSACMSEVRVLQLPDGAEGWAARRAPAADRVSVLLFGPTTARFAAPVAGLLFDSWQETVPAGSQTTGVALHLDAPGNQPPQLVLLGMAPTAGAWDLDGLAALAREVLALAKRRMVGPEILPELGQYLPGVAVDAGAS